jgi:hypothetical protein
MEVEYVLTDKGISCTRTEQVIVPQNSSVVDSLGKHLRKYRRAMGLSKNFTYQIITSHHIGLC